MKTSRKMSIASVAAIGLPVIGFTGAMAQAVLPNGPAASVSVTGGDALVLRSSTSTADSAAGQDFRSSGAVALVVDSDGQPVDPNAIDPMRGWDESDLDAYAAYWEAGYNYNQLLTLASEWNLSEFEAKARAGAAILAGDTSSFENIIAGIEPFLEELETYDAAASNPTDAFWDAGFTYDDALALAEVWNLDSWDAKILAAEMIQDGDQDDVEALLSA